GSGLEADYQLGATIERYARPDSHVGSAVERDIARPDSVLARAIDLAGLFGEVEGQHIIVALRDPPLAARRFDEVIARRILFDDLAGAQDLVVSLDLKLQVAVGFERVLPRAHGTAPNQLHGGEPRRWIEIARGDRDGDGRDRNGALHTRLNTI